MPTCPWPPVWDEAPADTLNALLRDEAPSDTLHALLRDEALADTLHALPPRLPHAA